MPASAHPFGFDARHNGRPRLAAASPAALRRLLESWRGHHVAVIGDLILDHFLWGDATRISPEAPVPVILLENESYRLGGAANVAANLRALGARVSLFGVIGRDEAGARLRALLAEQGIIHDGVLAVAGRPTTVKQRVLAQNKHVLRIDRELAGPIAAATAARLASTLARAPVRAVVASDYGKGCLTAPLMRRVLSAARRHRWPICVDPKGNELHFRGATLLKPNLRELAFLAGRPIRDERELAAAAEQVRRRHGCEHLLVTCGREGMRLFGAAGAFAIRSAAVDVADVTGAGDTVAAALTLALAAGAPPRHAALVANLAAGVVVAKPGTAVAGVAELLARLPALGPRRLRA